jgi:NAD(P)H-hydrate epimerase
MNNKRVPISYHICTARESRETDRKTIEDFGIDGFTLMEIAGNKAADFIIRNTANPSHALVFCGTGNNAGDALVLGRVLHQHGYRCSIVFVAGSESLSSETEKNLRLLNSIPSDSGAGIQIFDSFDATRLPEQFDFIVDGMLGTGIDSELRENYKLAVNWINSRNKPVFSMDIPSGIHTDSGEKLGVAVEAEHTLCFGSLKLGCFYNEGIQHSGKVHYIDLPFPLHLRSAHRYLLDNSWVQAEHEHRKEKRKHKYSEGILYLISGSEGLTGAAILSAKAAWSAGIGAVSILTPRGLLEIYEKQLIEIIKKPIGRDEDRFFKSEHLDEVLSVLREKPGKVIIGPGLGRNSSTVDFVHSFLSRYDGEVLIDADALFAMSMKGIKKPKDSVWICTPHTGELNMLGGTVGISTNNREKAVRSLSQTFEALMVSKGEPVIMGTTDDELYLTGYSSSFFSRAGFGDVLAGKIGAYWILNNDPVIAVGKALLDGYSKAAKFSAANDGTVPGPTDIL